MATGATLRNRKCCTHSAESLTAATLSNLESMKGQDIPDLLDHSNQYALLQWEPNPPGTMLQKGGVWLNDINLHTASVS